METAGKILLVGGVLNLAYGVVTGYSMSLTKMRGKEVPRYLTLAHLGPLMQGPALLGLVIAVGFSRLSSGTETLAAWMLVAGMGGVTLKDTINWLTHVRDDIAQRSLGFYLGGLSAALIATGLAIVIVGVVRAL